ncbi:hypothetical protein F5Y17DRAFT_205044 [Xylariaceae sp. FL0594]|nr:hypothetical protein F5Y17DRAFT_205044 [Xylariaceae sp. FL0594]
MSEQQPLPSYEDYRLNHHIRPSRTAEADRIFWTLNGPLQSSIWIISRGSLKPYAQGNDASNPAWHPISQCSLTEPKISSITVKVYGLDLWEGDWLYLHRLHMDEPDAFGADDENYVVWGPLPDCNPELDEPPFSEENPVWLVKCCGKPRPRGKGFKVVVQPSPGKEFVTIHDYVSTLHPRLLESRDDIIDNLCMVYDKVRPAEVKLFVNFNGPKSLQFDLDYESQSARWINDEKRRRPCPLVDDQ